MPRSVHWNRERLGVTHISRARLAAARWRGRAAPNEGDDSFWRVRRRARRSGSTGGAASRAASRATCCRGRRRPPSGQRGERLPASTAATMVERPYLDAGPVVERCPTCLGLFARREQVAELAAFHERIPVDAPEPIVWVSCARSLLARFHQMSPSAVARLRAQDAAGVRAAAQLLAQARVAAGDRLVQAARRGAQAVAHGACRARARRGHRVGRQSRAGRGARGLAARRARRRWSSRRSARRSSATASTRYGAEVIVAGAGYDEARRSTRSRSPPSAACRTSRPSTTTTSSPATASGSAARLREQHASLSRVIVPVGGGGLVAGLLRALRRRRCRGRRRAAERQLRHARLARARPRARRLRGGETLCEGLEGATAERTFAIARAHVYGSRSSTRTRRSPPSASPSARSAWSSSRRPPSASPPRAPAASPPTRTPSSSSPAATSSPALLDASRYRSVRYSAPLTPTFVSHTKQRRHGDGDDRRAPPRAPSAP